MLIAKNCSHWEEAESSTIIQTLQEGSCSQPHERFGFVLFCVFSFLSLSLLLHPSFLVVSSARSGDNLPFAEKDSALTVLAWCVCARRAQAFHCYPGKEKADVNRYPLRIHLAVL